MMLNLPYQKEYTWLTITSLFPFNMKQKILFYVLIFSVLINLYLISDYGKRLTYAQTKIDRQTEKITQLKDSIEVLQQPIVVPEATE